MTFLNALKPLLRGQSAVTFRLAPCADGGYRLLVTPTLQGIDPETADVELAHLQALLAAPFALTLSAEADLDQQFADAVTQFQALREPKLNELDALRARMEAAAADAKKRAEEAKAEAKAKAAAKGRTPPGKVTPKPQPAPPPTGDMFAALPGGPQQAQDGAAGSKDAPDAGTPHDDVAAEADSHSESSEAEEGVA